MWIFDSITKPVCFIILDSNLCQSQHLITIKCGVPVDAYFSAIIIAVFYPLFTQSIRGTIGIKDFEYSIIVEALFLLHMCPCLWYVPAILCSLMFSQLGHANGRAVNALIIWNERFSIISHQKLPNSSLVRAVLPTLRNSDLPSVLCPVAILVKIILFTCTIFG